MRLFVVAGSEIQRSWRTITPLSPACSTRMPAPPGFSPSRPFPRHDSSANTATSGEVGVITAPLRTLSTSSMRKDRRSPVVGCAASMISRPPRRYERRGTTTSSCPRRTTAIRRPSSTARSRRSNSSGVRCAISRRRTRRSRGASARGSIAPTRPSATHSSAECAMAMSPGPKQIAGMPAALSKAASVHADRPSMDTRSPPFRIAAARAAHDRSVHATSLGAARTRARPWPRSRAGAPCTGAGLLDFAAPPLQAARPGSVRRSTRSTHDSGYVDHPRPPLIVAACSEACPEQRMGVRSPDRLTPGGRVRAAGSRVTDGVHAHVVPAAVGGTTAHRNLDPRESAMRRGR